MGEKLRITRNSFNGGETSPQINLARADLDYYKKGCQTVENFIPMLRGGVTRRPGFEELVSAVDTDAGVYASTHRVLRFFYNLETEYKVILRRVAADQVNLVVVGTPSTQIIEDIGYYEAAGDFNEISYFQSGDVLFLFHPDYPTVRIERRADDDWLVNTHNYTAGPMEPVNIEKSKTISLTIPQYDNAAETPRDAGDVVMDADNSSTAITAAEYVYWYEDFYDPTPPFIYKYIYYKLRLTVASAAAFEIGNQVFLSGMTGSAHDWDGWHEVIGVGTGYIEISTGSRELWTRFTRWPGDVEDSWSVRGTINKWALTGVPEEGATAGKTSAAGVAFYMALHDDVTDADALPVSPATETEDWRLMSSTLDKVTASSSADLFAATDVGRKIMLTRGSPVTARGRFTVEGDVSVAIPVSESVRFTTDGGVWGGEIQLQESVDGGQTWEEIGKMEAFEGNYNGEISREVISLGSLVRAKMVTYEEWDSGSGDTDNGCEWSLEPEGTESIYGTIIDYTDARTVTVQLETPMTQNESGYLWALGAFGGLNGYPACGCIHEEGLVVAGVPGSPAWWYRSRLNNWNRFDGGTLATSAVKFQLPTSYAEQGLWVVSKSDVLLLGTQMAEWKIWGPDTGLSISFENIRMKRISGYGSAPAQPVLIEDAVVFCASDRRTLRVARYTYETDEITSTEILDIMAEHLPAADLVMMDVDNKRSVIWILDSGGEICSVTYDSANKVLAWARHNPELPDTASGISSLSCFTDSLALGFTMKTASNNLTLHEATFGSTVWKDYDGEAVAAFDSILQPTALTQNDEIGLNGGHLYKMSSVDLYLENSRGGSVSIDGGATWLAIVYETPTSAFTGRVRVNLNCRITADPDVMVKADSAYAFTLLALAVNVERTNSEVV